MERLVLVTDSSNGVGPATARCFEASGDTVALHPESLRTRDDVAKLASAFRSIDVLVANLNPVIQLSRRAEDDGKTQLFDAVVQPLFWLFSEFLERMKSRGGGVMVVPVLDPRGCGPSDRSAYELASTAQKALVRSIGCDVARYGVRVNAVASASGPSSMLGLTEWAEAMHWLASHDATNLTGTIVPAHSVPSVA